MARKLDWEYQDNCNESHAHIGDNYRIRAVVDDSPSNPFENDQGHWPIVVRDPDSLGHRAFTAYKFGVADSSAGMDRDLDMFTDVQLIHDQHAILAALGWKVIKDGKPTEQMSAAVECYLTDSDLGEGVPTGYITDAQVLRDLFRHIADDTADSAILDIFEALYKLAGVPAYCTQVNGYSQGDWCEVLVVATKEAQERFGNTSPTSEDLENTAKLYGWWAYGDVYGHIVEKAVRDPDADEDDEPEWEELPDGACWGFYGPDHDESGLEESALQSVPDEEMACA